MRHPPRSVLLPIADEAPPDRSPGLPVSSAPAARMRRDRST